MSIPAVTVSISRSLYCFNNTSKGIVLWRNNWNKKEHYDTTTEIQFFENLISSRTFWATCLQKRHILHNLEMEKIGLTMKTIEMHTWTMIRNEEKNTYLRYASRSGQGHKYLTSPAICGAWLSHMWFGGRQDVQPTVFTLAAPFVYSSSNMTHIDTCIKNTSTEWRNKPAIQLWRAAYTERSKYL
jgi:hypothetical protein